MKELTLKEVELAVKTMADTAITNEKYFSELDSAAGDGDFGVSLATGFRAVEEQWESFDRSSISSFLMKIGMTITSKVGGCSGPIWGTGFMRTGMILKGKKTLAVADLAEAAQAALDGIMARGGASLGDKTILDAIAPARDVLEDRGKNADEDILEALQAAAKAARTHAAETRGWVAKRGRQAFTGERSRGTDDPGIIGAVTMMENVAKALSDNRSE